MSSGHVTTFNTYNAYGQPLTITDPNGVVTTLTYDARQRITSRSAAGRNHQRFTYYPTGLMKQGHPARRQLPAIHLRCRSSPDRLHGQPG